MHRRVFFIVKHPQNAMTIFFRQCLQIITLTASCLSVTSYADNHYQYDDELLAVCYEYGLSQNYFQMHQNLLEHLNELQSCNHSAIDFYSRRETQEDLSFLIYQQLSNKLSPMAPHACHQLTNNLFDDLFNQLKTSKNISKTYPVCTEEWDRTDQLVELKFATHIVYKQAGANLRKIPFGLACRGVDYAECHDMVIENIPAGTPLKLLYQMKGSGFFIAKKTNDNNQVEYVEGWISMSRTLPLDDNP